MFENEALSYAELGLRPASSGTPAEWLQRGLDPTGTIVASYVPNTFARYARVLNPAFDPLTGRRLSWESVAHLNGGQVSSTSQWAEISAGQLSRSASIEPETGSLNPEVASALALMLAGGAPKQPETRSSPFGKGTLICAGAQLRE